MSTPTIRRPGSRLISALLCLLVSGLAAQADVTFTKVWPDKIRYLDGETAASSFN